jgi:2-polyprenyl-3-methyl-5-hydroxy-6-metoxy-1,4-benzoquinol methylase
MVKPQYYTAEKWEHAIALQSLAPKQRVLEIGCGDGLFLAMLKQAGHSGTGLEINEEAVRLGITAGLDIRNATIEKFAAGCTKPFDVVCAFQVLEHVTDPCSFLESALHCLRDDGLAIFAVPNGDGIFSSLDVAYDMPPHHMLRWNAAAFQFLTKHLSLPQHGLGAFRRKLIGTAASKYWSRYFGELNVAGHTLYVVFRKRRSRSCVMP